MVQVQVDYEVSRSVLYVLYVLSRITERGLRVAFKNSNFTLNLL